MREGETYTCSPGVLWANQRESFRSKNALKAWFCTWPAVSPPRDTCGFAESSFIWDERALWARERDRDHLHGGPPCAQDPLPDAGGGQVAEGFSINSSYYYYFLILIWINATFVFFHLVGKPKTLPQSLALWNPFSLSWQVPVWNLSSERQPVRGCGTSWRQNKCQILNSDETCRRAEIHWHFWNSEPAPRRKMLLNIIRNFSLNLCNSDVRFLTLSRRAGVSSE